MSSWCPRGWLRGLLLGAALGWLPAGGPGAAADLGLLGPARWTWTPSLEVGGTYDTNAYWWYQHEQDDLYLTVRPELLVERDTERTGMRLRAGVAVRRYAQEDELDTTDQRYRLHLERRWERLYLALDGTYVRDTTMSTELTAVGLSRERRTTKHWEINPSARLSLGERDAITVSPYFHRTTYRARGYTDYWLGGCTVTEEHALGERLWSLVQLGYSYVNLQDRLRYRNGQLMVGGRYLLGERTSLEVMAGARYTQIRARVRRIYLWWSWPWLYVRLVRESVSKEEWGAIATLNLRRELWRGRVELGYDRTVSPSGAVGQVERDRVRWRLRYELTERLRAGLDVDYWSGESTGGRKVTDYYTLQVRPSLTWRLTEHLELRFRFRRLFRDNRLADVNLERNEAFLGLAWSRSYR